MHKPSALPLLHSFLFYVYVCICSKCVCVYTYDCLSAYIISFTLLQTHIKYHRIFSIKCGTYLSFHLIRTARAQILLWKNRLKPYFCMFNSLFHNRKKHSHTLICASPFSEASFRSGLSFIVWIVLNIAFLFLSYAQQRPVHHLESHLLLPRSRLIIYI